MLGHPHYFRLKEELKRLQKYSLTASLSCLRLSRILAGTGYRSPLLANSRETGNTNLGSKGSSIVPSLQSVTGISPRWKIVIDSDKVSTTHTRSTPASR